MLTARCSTPKCRNADPRNRQNSLFSAMTVGLRTSLPKIRDDSLWLNPAGEVTAVAMNATTLSPISTSVISPARATTLPP